MSDSRHIITGEIIDSIHTRRIAFVREYEEASVMREVYGIIHKRLGRYKAMIEAEYTNESRRLDRIYDFCDRLFKIDNFLRVDAALRALSLDATDDIELLGWLTATLPAWQKLPGRERIYNFAEAKLGKELVAGLRRTIEQCPRCEGKGIEYRRVSCTDYDPFRCRRCDGTGKVVITS